MIRLRALLPVLAYAILSGCSGDSSQTSAPSYHAQVITNEEDTEVQLLKFAEDGAESPTVEDLDTWRLGYGAMKYLVGQGSVPSLQTDMPTQCLNSSTLGTDAAGPCVARPLLASFVPILRSLGIDKQEVTLNPMYSTNDGATYTQTGLVAHVRNSAFQEAKKPYPGAQVLARQVLALHAAEHSDVTANRQGRHHGS